MKAKLLALTFLLALFSSHAGARADAPARLDGDTDGQVIDRLERALEDMDNEDGTKSEVMIRLADLYAERARISEMNEVAKEVGAKSPVGPCETCKVAKSDRQRSIELYSQVFEKGSVQDKDRLLLQMAHLNQLNGEESKAEVLFKKILAHPKKHSAELVAQSHAGFGEILYRRAKFKDAKKHFESALDYKDIEKRGQLIYRLAWCNLNLGNLKMARTNLEMILKDPSLISYKVGDQTKVDNSFHEEVSRDYATFLSRGEVKESDIINLINLSPEVAKTDNVFHLANELDRLGKKKASLNAWRIANSRQTDPNEKLEGFVKMAQVQYDIGNKPLAANEVENAFQFWKSEGCKKDQNCEELQHKLRKLITDWDRASKKSPSSDLFKAYSAYIGYFQNDTEMIYWAASLAKRLNKNEEAAPLFRRSTNLAKSNLKSAEGTEQQTKLRNIFEGSLLNEIESAELSKNFDLRLEAYKNYLAHNPKGEKAGEVRYQIHHISYEKGDYKRAAEGFRDLVRDNQFPQQLKVQSADLAIDSLNILKDGDRLEKWSLEFSELVPARRNEYLDISRKSALNKVALSVSNDASDSELRSSLNKMNGLSLTGMTKDQKISYLKDKIVIARRLKDIGQVRQSSQELAQLTKFSSRDNLFARQQLLWVAESTLDFKSAYKLAKVTDIPGKSAVDMELQLGIYADLAGLNPSAHYERFIGQSSNRQSARQVMVSLIKKSKNPSATFKRFESELSKDASLYAPLALEDFGRNQNLTLAKARLSRPQMRSTPEAFVVYRHSALSDFKKSSKALMFHRLNKSSDRALKQSLTQRLQLLKSAERQAQQVIQNRDWTLQLVHIDFLSNEYARLYRDILSLPVPRQLNRAQREQYKNLLRAQAEPYRIKSLQLEQKIDQLWSQSDMGRDLQKDFSRTKGPLRNLMITEVQTLLRIAPAKYKSDLRKTLTLRPAGIDENSLQRALQNVKNDPFDAGNLEHLKDLEQKAGRHAMVAFLEAKVDQLKKGDRP